MSIKANKNTKHGSKKYLPKGQQGLYIYTRGGEVSIKGQYAAYNVLLNNIQSINADIYSVNKHNLDTT